jgi:exopolysaccharide production protein ExoY
MRILGAFSETGQPSEVPSWKRVLDITCICLALPLLLPLVALVAFVIKLVSPGPVFYRQERAGYRGAPFLCWKFRTMKPNADTGVHERYLHRLIESNQPMTKLDTRSDDRLIPGGWILRASGLDEVPQLFNVLRGDMSIVGPRPCTPAEYRKYKECQLERFNTLPGLTGLWQVSGKNKTTFKQMIALDIRYVREKSLAFDLKIMLRTFSTLIGQILETWMSKPATAALDHPLLVVKEFRRSEENQ